MAIAAQEQVSPEFPAPKRGARQPGAAWSNPAQLWRSLPMVRLLAEIWSVSEVGSVGVHVDEEGVHLRVLIASDVREARAKIYDAERDYLNATRSHGFDMHVTPAAKAGRDMPEPFETVLTR